MKDAIINAYRIAENTTITLDADVELINDTNPDTGLVEYGIAFSGTVSSGYHEYLVIKTVEVGSDYVLMIDDAGGSKCISITCTPCKKKLFRGCHCTGGDCDKVSAPKSLLEAFAEGLD